MSNFETGALKVLIAAESRLKRVYRRSRLKVFFAVSNCACSNSACLLPSNNVGNTKPLPPAPHASSIVQDDRVEALT